MSVLIKNMEMPQNCYECLLRASCVHRIYLEERPHDCPLIPVPSHGLLSFARLVAESVTREDFEDSAGAFAEIFCRWLRNLGIVNDENGYWTFTPTNADRIRSMTDEELAEWIASYMDCGECKINSPKCMANDGACVRQWLDWLRQEAKE